MPTHRVVSIDELSQYLHLPEKAVAKELGICLTSLKKLCRQHGITRWPYRKLKSLDKKLAKAESGAGGDEDPEAQKARAEEIRKEKMAVAFSYGIKPGKETAAGADSGEKVAEDDSTESGSATPPADVSDMLSVEGMLVAEIAKAVSNPKKQPQAEGALASPTCVLAKSVPHVWPAHAHGSRDSPTSIPTPPGDEPFDTMGEEADVDLLADAENVIASTALMEDSRMSASISWEAPSLDDAVVEPAGDCDGDTPPNCNTPASLSSAPDFPADTSTSPGKKKAGDKKALAAKGGAPGRYSIPRSLPSRPGSQRRVRTALALYQYQGSLRCTCSAYSKRHCRTTLCACTLHTVRDAVALLCVRACVNLCACMRKFACVHV